MPRAITALLIAILSGAALPADILIRDVSVVDVAAGTVIPHRAVLIHGDRIASISGRSPRTRTRYALRVINGSGKFLIPGLWDMHVHLWYDSNQFPQFLSWGVTGVRDMGSDLARVGPWRREVNEGRLLGPHVETCGSPVSGMPSVDARLPVLLVRTPREARTAYDRVEDAGSNCVDILPTLPRDAYFALLERARKWGLPVAGAVPYTVSALEAAADARQDSIENFSGILLACSTEERRVRMPLAEAIGAGNSAAVCRYQERILDTFSEAKAAGVITAMARYQVRQVPVLSMLRGRDGADADASELWKRKYLAYRELLIRMQRAGVPILAGSGTGAPHTVPGLELHRELTLLVDAGLTPAQALRTATIEPARSIDADESLGSVAEHKIADLVMLNANPLQNIANTQKISLVIVGGKIVQPAGGKRRGGKQQSAPPRVKLAAPRRTAATR